jgi:AcrR family transcriptional regulator
MSSETRNAEKTKLAITKAARRLFAQHDISSVSFRGIAAAAGVSHGLVQQYFGTREHMIAEIIRNEIEEFSKLLPPDPAVKTKFALEDLRAALNAGETRFRDYARLITRAELMGVKPERMLDPAIPTPAMALACSIRDLQAESPISATRMAPQLVSAYINASLFAFATLSPWLMASVGLDPKNGEARLDEIREISMKLISLAVGKATP